MTIMPPCGVIRGLGAAVENLSDGSLFIESKGIRPVNDFVNCGESGLGIRMFAPLVALSGPYYDD